MKHPECPPGPQTPATRVDTPAVVSVLSTKPEVVLVSCTGHRAPGSLWAGDNPDSGLAGRARQVCVCLCVMRVHVCVHVSTHVPVSTLHARA